MAWCYPRRSRVTYPYTFVKRHKEPAFTMREVMKMLGRKSRTPIQMAIVNGDLPEPASTYTLDEEERKIKYLFHEDDILALHKYLSEIHVGRPRKDGFVTPTRLPNERELRAMIRQEQVFYVKVGDEFVPTFRAPEI